MAFGIFFSFAGAGRPHAQRITFFERGACEYTYFSIFMYDWMGVRAHTNAYFRYDGTRASEIRRMQPAVAVFY